MDAKTGFFYFFSAVLLYSALRVITSRNPVHAVLHLILGFSQAAAIWLLLKAEFLGIMLVVVYMGAVMVLFLFVVMMLDIDFERLREGFWRNLPLAGTVAAIMVAEMTLILVSPDVGLSNFKEPAALAADYSNVKDLGRQIYTTYLYPFELAAVLLLLAIVAAIALTMRKRKDNKWVDPAEQVKVRRNDRIRMVKMAAEPRVQRGGETDNDNAAA